MTGRGIPKVELLSPAGSYEGMKAVFAAGADAVYIGGQRFGARAYADNPDEDGLKRAIRYAHEKNKKLYLTVNTLLKDAELEELYGFLNPLYREGLDAVIVQDLGVLRYVRDLFPKMHIHASTQMGITGPYGAQFLKEQGASRVVTARELSLAEIRAIHKKTDVEIESFVHGALCFCYSGQCLFSSMIGGRSGNRGRCAQPCRLPYELQRGEQTARGFLREGRPVRTRGRYLLSPKDICTLDILPDLVKSGIASFKIEGRMKREEYAAGVTQIYRRCLDRYYADGGKDYYVAEDERRMLLDLYNRGGFSEGYYRQHNGPEMMALHASTHHGSPEAGKGAGLPEDDPQKRARYEALLRELRQKFVLGESVEKINGKLILSAQKPAILELYYGNYKIRTRGQTLEAAKNRPLSEADVEKQLRKTGGSGFLFDGLSIELEDGLFLPLQAINELRRAAFAELKETIACAHSRENGAYRPPERAADTRPEADGEQARGRISLPLAASIENADCLAPLCGVPGIGRIYLDCNAFESREEFLRDSVERIALCHASGKTCWYVLPWIFRREALEFFDGEALSVLSKYDGVLIRNQEEYAFLTARGFAKEMAADWNLYTYNREAVAFWRGLGLAFDTVPPELNRRELAVRGCAGSELIVYGYQALMVTAQCQVKNLSGCRRQPQTLWLKDRMQKRFAVRNHCLFCYNTIYNSTPLELCGSADEVRRLRPDRVRLQFSLEDAGTAAEIAGAYAEVFGAGRPAERKNLEFTRGHFERGVE